MYIVFDTNIWRSELGLTSAAGAAVRFYIKREEATVVVPEVVRLEFEEILTSHLKQLRNDILKSHGELLRVFGELKEVVLASGEEIHSKVSDIIPSLDIPFTEVPFSFDVARSSFLKIIKKEPPSKNTQLYP